MQMNLLTKRLYSKSQIILFDEQLRRNFIKRLHEKWSLKHPRYRIKSIKNHERNSATLIALIDVDHCPCVLFTHRSLNLRDHRGQVSFPGGRIEDGETSEQVLLFAARDLSLKNSFLEIDNLNYTTQLTFFSALGSPLCDIMTRSFITVFTCTCLTDYSSCSLKASVA